jgi:hypothetical protein
LNKIELALEILHTRSKTVQDSQNKSTQHVEEETIEVTFNSRSIQLKIKKNCSTRLTDVLASVHPTLGGSSDAPVGLSSLDTRGNQVNNLYSTG